MHAFTWFTGKCGDESRKAVITSSMRGSIPLQVRRASAGTGFSAAVIHELFALDTDSAASPSLLVAVSVNTRNVVTSLPEPFDWLFEKARFGLFRT